MLFANILTILYVTVFTAWTSQNFETPPPRYFDITAGAGKIRPAEALNTARGELFQNIITIYPVILVGVCLKMRPRGHKNIFKRPADEKNCPPLYYRVHQEFRLILGKRTKMIIF